MDSWQSAYAAFLRLLTPEQCDRLHFALATDDPRLVQGQTVLPEPLTKRRLAMAAECACLVGHSALPGTVGAVDLWVADVAEKLTPATFAKITGIWDETPRREAIALFLAETRRFIKERAAV